MKRQVADRVFFSSVSLVIVANAVYVPESLMFKIVHSGGLAAWACMAFLFGSSIVTLFDTVVNDMLPPRFAWKTALGRRRGIWMALAMTFGGICFVVVKNGYSWWGAIYFFLFALRAAGCAFLDLYYEYKPVINDPETPISGTIPGVLGDE